MSIRTAHRQVQHKNLHRKNLLWLAALLHRLSGLALAIFLPVHFLTLGLAIDGEARLDSFLRWSDAPAVKIGEAVLIFLLAVHALGGLRLLAVVENLASARRAEAQPRRDGGRGRCNRRYRVPGLVVLGREQMNVPLDRHDTC